MTAEEFFQNIHQNLNKQLPFVVYRKPNEVEVKAILQNTDKLYITEDYSEKGFVMAPFDSTRNSILIPFEDSLSLTCHSVNLGEAFESSNKVDLMDFDCPKTDVQKNFHVDLVKTGIEAIKDAQFAKVVLSRRELFELEEVNPLATRSEEHTSELQSRPHLVCRLLLEKKKK